MRKILITGNGFDLHHQLPTSYNVFIEVLNNLQKLENCRKYSFNKVFPSKYKPADCNKAHFKLDTRKIKLFIANYSKNKWYKIFSDIKNEMTWIDFEDTLEKILFNICTFLSDYERTINPKIYSRSSDYEINNRLTNYLASNPIITMYLNDFDIIVEDEISIGIDDNQDHITDRIYTINDSYKDIRADYYKVSIEKIARDLIKELNQFRKIFNQYFELIVYPLYQCLSLDKDEDIFQNIAEHYTFNYTPTFEKVYRKGITKHIHGSINNNIVLGINGLPNDFSFKKDFIPFTKVYQKLRYSSDIKFLNNVSLNKLSADEILYIFIWGHSLDISDSQYLKEVFNVSELKDKNKVIIIIKDSDSIGKLLVNLIHIFGDELIYKLMRLDKLEFVEYNTERFKELLKRNIRSGGTLDEIMKQV